MNRRKVSNKILLYFLMMMFLVATVGTGCSNKDDAPPAATTYTISGVVSGGIAVGVTINLTGATTATTTTATGGTYSFTGLSNGTYTVTPVLANYTFAPTSTAIVVNGSNMTADFVATYNTSTKYTITGTVSGAVEAGVKITLSGDATGETTTLTGGTYSFTNLVSGNYTVTPYLSGYSFAPTHRDIALSANSTGNDFTATAAPFTQADLIGTWNVHMLKTGSSTGWMHAKVSVDSAGLIIFDTCPASGGGSSCPTGPIVWTINSTTGVISETDNTVATDSHLTMASNKNFIAGTGTSDGGGAYQLLVIQKDVPGTVYANADLQSKNFVFHQFNVGASKKWKYGAGSTSSTRDVTISSETDAVSGASTPGATGSIISVDPAGVVTMTGTGMATYNGFLSADKRTIVGTVTDGTEYHMLIIQLTDGQSSTLTQVYGISYNNMLSTGVDDFWSHVKIGITSGGVMNFSEYVGPGSGPTGSETISIGLSGTATIAGSTIQETTFNGQLSYDGKFMVATQTTDTGIYTLNIITH
jgi:hypothetical protein